MVNVTTVLNVIQVLLASPGDDPVHPWVVDLVEEAGLQTWYVQIRIPAPSNPYSTFTGWYWNIQSVVERSPGLGFVVVEPRLAIIHSISLQGHSHICNTFAFTFRLCTAGGQQVAIQNPLSLLEIENPLSLRECDAGVSRVRTYLLHHRLFGFTQNSVLRVIGLEITLTTASVQFKVHAVRTNDPHCSLPLPRRLEDYDLAPAVRLLTYHLLQTVYQASSTDLACRWVFVYTVRTPQK